MTMPTPDHRAMCEPQGNGARHVPGTLGVSLQGMSGVKIPEKLRAMRTPPPRISPSERTRLMSKPLSPRNGKGLPAENHLVLDQTYRGPLSSLPLETRRNPVAATATPKTTRMTHPTVTIPSGRRLTRTAPRMTMSSTSTIAT